MENGNCMVASKILVGLLLAVWLWLSGSIAPAWASIHTYPEAEQQTAGRDRPDAGRPLLRQEAAGQRQTRK